MLFATLVEAGTPFLSLSVVGAGGSEGTHSLAIPSSVKAEHGKLHAATQEEQILYPGAIMVGEYLKLKLKR